MELEIIGNPASGQLQTAICVCVGCRNWHDLANLESMMLKKFKTYQHSIEFYHKCEKIKCPTHLKDQLLRAASSISLNLSEGSAKPTPKDRKKFYYISMGSLRECQTLFDLMALEDSLDLMGAQLYKLLKSINVADNKPTSHWP
jgi:four helix bundle protein